MPRVSVSDVLQILGSALSEAKLLIHITTASELMDQVFSGDTVLNEGLKKEIERYLAAHFASIAEPEISGSGILEHEIGATRVKFSDNLGEMLRTTRFGQQALVLDVTGKLSGTGKSRALFRAT
jgi:hypothetical protein